MLVSDFEELIDEQDTITEIDTRLALEALRPTLTRLEERPFAQLLDGRGLGDASERNLGLP